MGPSSLNPDSEIFWADNDPQSKEDPENSPKEETFHDRSPGLKDCFIPLKRWEQDLEFKVEEVPEPEDQVDIDITWQHEVKNEAKPVQRRSSRAKKRSVLLEGSDLYIECEDLDTLVQRAFQTLFTTKPGIL